MDDKEIEYIPLPTVYEPGMAERIMEWIIWGNDRKSV